MQDNKRNALLFLLAGICFLFVGIMNFKVRSLTFYGNIAAGVLFIIAAIRNYTKRTTPPSTP